MENKMLPRATLRSSLLGTEPRLAVHTDRLTLLTPRMSTNTGSVPDTRNLTGDPFHRRPLPPHVLRFLNDTKVPNEGGPLGIKDEGKPDSLGSNSGSTMCSRCDLEPGPTPRGALVCLPLCLQALPSSSHHQSLSPTHPTSQPVPCKPSLWKEVSRAPQSSQASQAAAGPSPSHRAPRGLAVPGRPRSSVECALGLERRDQVPQVLPVQGPPPCLGGPLGALGGAAMTDTSRVPHMWTHSCVCACPSAV